MKIQGVNFLLIRKDGKVLIQKRDWKRGIAYPGRWAIPGGGKEENESPEQAVIREIKEETGVEISFKSLQKIMDFPYSYKGVQYINRFFLCRIGDIQVYSLEGRMHWVTIQKAKNINLVYKENEIIIPLVEEMLRSSLRKHKKI